MDNTWYFGYFDILEGSWDAQLLLFLSSPFFQLSNVLRHSSVSSLILLYNWYSIFSSIFLYVTFSDKGGALPSM